MEYTIAQIAYLAGILDGEGTISICDKRIMKRKSKGIRKTNKVYRARVNFSTNVTVCNTDPVIIDWLVANFGGSVSYSKRQKTNWKQKITWIMPTAQISIILEKVLPYLVLKKEQAKLMIEARKTFDENQRQLLTSDEVYNRRLEIANLIRLHNKKALRPCCPSA
jgi:hypothetical protein